MKKALETANDMFKAKLWILLTTIAIMAFALLLQQAGSASSAVQQAGAVSDDKSVWWDVNGVGLLKITPEVAKAGETVLYEYANYTAFNEGLNITIRFGNNEGYIDSVEVLRNVQKPAITYNTSVEELYNTENASYYNQTTTNTSITNTTVREWVNVPAARKIIGNDHYYTAQFFAGEQVRYKPKAKTYGGLIKYDTILHPSKLSPTQPVRVEIDPVLNATAFNVTSNSDLNLTGCQPDCAKFISGHLLLAAGNKSNLTNYESYSGGFTDLMTRWTPYNTSNAAGGFAPAGYSISIIDGALNMSVGGPGDQAANTLLVGSDNLSVSETSGMIVSWRMKYARTDGVGGYGHAIICFVNSWDTITGNVSVNGQYCTATNSNTLGQSIGAGSYSDGGGAKAFGYHSASTTDTNFGIGTRCQDCYNHFTWWFNWTHHRIIVNQSEGGSVDSGLLTIPAGAAKMSSGGKLVIDLNAGSSTTPNAVAIENLTVANASQFGQPLNLTAAQLKTNIINSTATVSSVKVSNLTFNYSDTTASWYAFDRSHANLQSLTEGTFNTLNNVTGLGINATVSPTHLDSATELTSILVEWQKGSGTANATEQQGDEAIVTAVQSSVPNARRYPNQKVYVVNASNTQWQGTADYLVIQDSPPKRWLLNYITTGENYINARNLSNVVYVLELANKTSLQIEQEMTALLDATKG